MRYTYEYDLSDNQLSSLYEYYFRGRWILARRETSKYDVNDNLISLTEESYDDGQWEGRSNYLYEYDLSLNLISSTHQNWDEGKWENESVTNYSFDALGKLISSFGGRWGDGKFMDEWRRAYTYNSEGKIVELLGESLVDGEWVRRSMLNYGYDINGNVSSFTSVRWVNSVMQPDDESYDIFDGSMNSYGGYFGHTMSLTYKQYLSKEKTKYEQVPSLYQLSQNYPNPFNPATKIDYDLPTDGKVTLKIYDMLGCEVKTLVDEYQESGKYTTSFDAGKLSSGIYVYKLVSGSYSAQKKMLFLK